MLNVLIPVSSETGGGILSVILNDTRLLKDECKFTFLIFGSSNCSLSLKLESLGFKVYCTNREVENFDILLDNCFYYFRNRKKVQSKNLEDLSSYILDEEKVDLIHSHKIGFLPILGKVAKNRKIPIVQSIHTILNYPYPLKLGERFSAYHINKYSAHTYGVAGVALNQFKGFLNRQKASVIYNMPVVDCIDSKNKNNFTIGVLTRIKPAKGLEFFLDAAKNIIKKKPEIKVIVAGVASKGNVGYFDELKSKIDSYENISFPGFMKKEEFYSQVSILCNPSLSEVCSMVILEAFKAGVCVLATNVGGNSELITNEYNGLLANPGSSEEIETGLLKLIASKSLREKLSDNAKKTCEEKFSSAIHRESLMNIYKKVLG